jgi:hypothetical protein
MVKKITLAGLLLIICVGSFLFYNEFLALPDSMEKQPIAHKLTALELYGAYEEDEMSADLLYLNKVMLIEGIVASVDQTDQDQTLSLETNGFGVIKCTLAEDDKTKDLSTLVGKEINIKGECIGMLLDVLINNAIIINQ